MVYSFRVFIGFAGAAAGWRRRSWKCNTPSKLEAGGGQREDKRQHGQSDHAIEDHLR